MYRTLFTLVLSKFDPERAHHLAFVVIQALPTLGFGRLVRRFTRPDPSLKTKALGLEFDSPFGVAAGFDKDGKAVIGLGQLGFGHVEVGTITAIAQPGNDKPRLFRLIPDRAVINRMGFNNGGAVAAADRLAPIARRTTRAVLGVNIGKSRVVAVEDATADYLTSARALAPVADYLVVNVSSPNTPGLRKLQAREFLREILAGISTDKPVLVKIAPDLSFSEIDDILALSPAGIVATNTTLTPEGGLSGEPLRARATECIRHIRRHSKLPIIGVGGIFSAVDAYAKIRAGASLVEVWTGLIYEGPALVRDINRGLLRLLERDGFGSIAEAVGTE